MFISTTNIIPIHSRQRNLPYLLYIIRSRRRIKRIEKRTNLKTTIEKTIFLMGRLSERPSIVNWASYVLSRRSCTSPVKIAVAAALGYRSFKSVVYKYIKVVFSITEGFETKICTSSFHQIQWDCTAYLSMESNDVSSCLVYQRHLFQYIEPFFNRIIS